MCFLPVVPYKVVMCRHGHRCKIKLRCNYAHSPQERNHWIRVMNTKKKQKFGNHMRKPDKHTTKERLDTELEYQHMTTNLRRVNAECDVLKMKLGDMTENLDDVTEKLDDVTEKLDDVTEKLDDMTEKKVKLVSENIKLKKTNNDLRSLLPKKKITKGTRRSPRNH